MNITRIVYRDNGKGMFVGHAEITDDAGKVSTRKVEEIKDHVTDIEGVEIVHERPARKQWPFG